MAADRGASTGASGVTAIGGTTAPTRAHRAPRCVLDEIALHLGAVEDRLAAGELVSTDRMADRLLWIEFAVRRQCDSWPLMAHTRPTAAPTESLLTEAMLKHVCVLPNLAYLESPQGIPRTARKIVAGHNRAIVDRIKEVAGKATRAMNFLQSSLALGRALRRIEPALAARGVIMERERVTAGTRIRFRMTGQRAPAERRGM